MEKFKKYIALFYIVLLSAFLLIFFSKFSLQDLTSYKFIQMNREYFLDLRESNIIMISFIFLALTTIWVFMLGFGSPVALLAGFIFGKWIGLLIVALGCTFGATLLYIFGNYFLEDLIKKNFLERFKNLQAQFKKNEFVFFLIYRFVGGIPFPVANLLPIMFNVTLRNYFYGTLFGLLPGLLVMVSLGSGIEKIIKENLVAPSISEVMLSPDVYIPILGLVALIILTIIVKRYFIKVD